MHDKMDNSTREIKVIRNNQVEMLQTKNTKRGINNACDELIEERISDLEDTLI